MNPSLFPGSTEWRMGPGTHSLSASRSRQSHLQNMSKSNRFLLPALLPPHHLLWTRPVQLPLLCCCPILFGLFATQQLGEPEVRSQHTSVANPTYLGVKGDICTAAHEAVQDTTPFYPISS